MSAIVAAPAAEPPQAWNDRMLLAYPQGGTVRYDPCGRFYRAGDVLNGYVLDRFELEGEVVVAILRIH